MLEHNAEKKNKNGEATHALMREFSPVATNTIFATRWDVESQSHMKQSRGSYSRVEVAECNGRGYGAKR